MNAPCPQLSGKQIFVNLADASSTRKQIFVWIVILASSARLEGDIGENGDIVFAMAVSAYPLIAGTGVGLSPTRIPDCRLVYRGGI